MHFRFRKPTEILQILGVTGTTPEPEPLVKPLRFTNVGEGDATVAFTKNGSTTLQIRSGKGAYTDWDLKAVTIPKGGYIEVVGENSKNNTSIGRFVMTGTIAASGSVMTLLYGADCTEEENLVIPFQYCFGYAADTNTGLFRRCTSLTTAPELPATTLADYCYQSMFSGCTSLTTAPELPATTLAGYCYSDMFSGCTSLTTAPELSATTLADYCYQYMFGECTMLKQIKVTFIYWFTIITNYWMVKVPEGGTFYKPSALPTRFGDDYIPTGWTVVNID